MKRRDFIKITAGGVAAAAVAGNIPGVLNTPAFAASPINQLNIAITDALKEMHCFNGLPEQQDPNSTCYFWVYQMSVEFVANPGVFVDIPVEVPGPTILATQGDTIPVTITNNLTQEHAFFIPGIFGSGPIAPGATINRTINVTGPPGTYLYFDNRNAPVNRVMGLHGAFVVMPAAASGARWTPYAAGQVTPQVQQLFNDLGTANFWPGLAWEEGDAATLTAPFRQNVWITHQASQKLFSEVGSNPGIFPSGDFVNAFRRDPFRRDSFSFAGTSRIPQHFTITGQQGHFCHNNPIITPMARVGEPVVVRVMNAGLMTQSMHLHANHFYLISVDRIVQGAPDGADPSLRGAGPIWIDTMTLNPFGERGSAYDMVIPFMRPPDVPNRRGIGRGGAPDAALPTAVGRTWPPQQEFDVFMPAGGTAQGQDPADPTGQTLIPVPLAQRESPLCYPMHDHSEPTQSTQGGNYNTALISGMYIIGDRNIALPRFNVDDLWTNPGGNPGNPLLPPQTFPMDDDFAMMLGLDQTPQILAYGIDEARRTGIQEACQQSDLESQRDRPPFPPGFNDPAFP
jgi:FtsP/CotA-like multicopper oxidase with cupredoxin domain